MAADEEYIALIEAEGVGPTIEFALEECGEFIVAAQHRRRGRPHNLAEEAADVMIMMDRVALFFPEALEIKEKKLAASREAWLNGSKGAVRRKP